MLEREPRPLATRFKENLKPLGRKIAFPLSSVVLTVAAACTSGHATGEVTTGDVDCDGRINSIDSLLILQKDARLIGELLCEDAADVSGDDIINAVDAALILQLDAGLIDEFPAEKEPTETNTAIRTATRTATRARTPTLTPTITATETRTNTPTNTPTLTPTNIPTETPTVTLIPTPTMMPTETPTGEPRLTDEELIDMTEAQAAKYLWERTLPNGFVKDTEFSPDSSIAATGFGLASLPVMAERYGENANWTVTPDQARERTRLILDSALNYQNQQTTNPEQFGKAGLLFHFIDESGQRSGESEVSTVDMALFLAGALTAGQYFGGDIQEKANVVFDNVDWQYFFDSTNNRFHHAWKSDCSPGFGVSAPDGDGCLSNQRWDRPTDEIILVNLLALTKDPNNEGFKRSLYAWPRVVRSYGGYDVVNSYFGSLFTYIYAHAFFDFEKMGLDNPAGVGSDVQAVNWFENSWNAACANRQFVRDQYLSNSARYNTYGFGWGLSAAYRPDGTYFGDTGAAPAEADGGNPRHDGTVPPYGAISTFPILSDNPCLGESTGANHPLETLRNYWEKFDRLWGRYGPRDSFQVELLGGFPVQRYSSKYVGLDVGIEALMIENWRTSLINNLFMSHPQILNAVNIQFPDTNLPVQTK